MGSFSLFPSRDKCKTLQGGKKWHQKKKKSPLLKSFDQEKMLKVDPHWSEALLTALSIEKGERHAVDGSSFPQMLK